jgi:nucleotide-binding universal stress UspA family protein
MYSKILVPMALDHGVAGHSVEIARKLLDEGGEIIALHVYEAPQGMASAYLDDKAVQSAFEKVKDHLHARAKELGNLKPVVLQGHSARTIVDYAARENVDCIILGSHKPGFSDYLLGSTAARVARHSGCAVHITRNA